MTAHERLSHRASPQDTQEAGRRSRYAALGARGVDATLRLQRAAPEPIAYASCHAVLRTFDRKACR